MSNLVLKFSTQIFVEYVKVTYFSAAHQYSGDPVSHGKGVGTE